MTTPEGSELVGQEDDNGFATHEYVPDRAITSPNEKCTCGYDRDDPVHG